LQHNPHARQSTSVGVSSDLLKLSINNHDIEMALSRARKFFLALFLFAFFAFFVVKSGGRRSFL
jgi:hypothetical protein